MDQWIRHCRPSEEDAMGHKTVGRTVSLGPAVISVAVMDAIELSGTASVDQFGGWAGHAP